MKRKFSRVGNKEFLIRLKAVCTLLIDKVIRVKLFTHLQCKHQVFFLFQVDKVAKLSILIRPDGKVYINSTGTPAMATPGSGDVLTGIIAGLAAQGVSLQEATLCGVFLHGLAGEYAADGKVGLAAGEIANFLPEARADVFEMLDTEELVYNHAVKVIE